MTAERFYRAIEDDDTDLIDRFIDTKLYDADDDEIDDLYDAVEDQDWDFIYKFLDYFIWEE